MIFIRVIASLSLICTLFFSTGSSQTISTRLKDRKVSIKVVAEPLGSVFGRLMFEYDLNIGFEESTDDREHSDYKFETNLFCYTIKSFEGQKFESAGIRRLFNSRSHFISLDLAERPLSEVLDRVVEQMSNYRWEINDGVINIIPTKGRDETFRQFLDLRIAKYYLDKGTRVGKIKSSLAELPEVKEFLLLHKLNYSYYRAVIGELNLTINESANFSSIKIRDLLNRIAKLKNGGWILTQQVTKHTREKYLDLDI